MDKIESKRTGAEYTPKILADFVARKILEAWEPRSPLEKVRVFDPAVGDGELLIAMLGELTSHDYSNIGVYGYDTNKNALQIATTRITRGFPRVDLHLKWGDFLSILPGIDLFSCDKHLEKYDLIIANPPYVRTQVMGAKKAQDLASKFGLSGRVDLYYAFIFGIAQVLQQKGMAGIIVSNRFMTIKSGETVRKHIVKRFDVLHIWDLGDTKLFKASVLPAVLLVKPKGEGHRAVKPACTSIYSTVRIPGAQYVPDVISALETKGIVKLPSNKFFQVLQGQLDHKNGNGEVWRISTKSSDEWLNTVESNTYCTYREVGKTHVGVKTNADKIFIREDWDDLPLDMQPECLHPVITHHIARRFKAFETNHPKEILYTHRVMNGKRTPIDLDGLPRTRNYLNQYRGVLEGRKYIYEAGRQWFEIWVPQDPNVWAKPKVVFRDISDIPMFWLDFDGSIVNGDCYWITCEKRTNDDLLWLIAAIGNSSFVEAFYDYKFCNKLYSGRRRFMTQYVEQFPLPNPKSNIGLKIIQLAKQIYDLITTPKAQELEKELNLLVWESFGVNPGKNP